MTDIEDIQCCFVTYQIYFTRENITEFCLTSEINLIFNKTTLNFLFLHFPSIFVSF